MNLGTLLILLASTALANSLQYSKSLYTTYKLIENAVLSDSKLMFEMREAFYPTISQRFWQVDGVQVIPISMCLTFISTNNESMICGTKNSTDSSTTYCEDFRWTNSYLLNLISGEVLLAMDSVLYIATYSNIVRSIHNSLLQIKLTEVEIKSDCVPSYNDFLASSTLFLSWSKLYATENSGKPLRWNSKYQGYVAKWYSYFGADSYFPELHQQNYQPLYIQWGLRMTFTLLNILIPVVCIRRGKQLSHAIALLKNKSVIKRICIVLTLLNVLYLLAMVILHCHGNPSVLNRIQNCRDAVVMFITKIIILPIAMLTELIAAVYVTKNTIGYSYLCVSLVHVLALWQVFLFAQITVGLISIPLVIVVLTSPAQSILTLTILMLPFLLLTFTIVAIPCIKSCKNIPKSCWIKALETTLIVCLVTVAFITYYAIVSYGAVMESVKGYILSLIPAVPISISIWMIKQKLQGEIVKLNKHKGRQLKTVLVKQQSCSSSTEEEIIQMSDTSADEASD